MIAAILLLATAAAAPEHGPEHYFGGRVTCGEHHEAPLADIIFHHVSDDYSMEVPGPGLACSLRLGVPASARVEGVEPPPSLFGTWTLPLGERTLDLTPTRHVLFLWIAAGLVLLIVLLATRSYRRKKTGEPSGIGTFVEMIVQFIHDEIAVKNIGHHHAHHYVPYLLTIFFFILIMNLIGLVPFGATATSNIAVTASLASLTFLVTTIAGMAHQGPAKYWLHLVPSGVPLWLWPIMLPVEILGLFTKPFALTVRLFANMIAGHIVIFFLLGLIFILSPYVAPLSIGFALGIFLLELFVALVQAYIFTMLSALFIGMASHSH